MELAFFLFFAVTGILAAVGLIFQRNPIYSALCLIVVIASIGGLFLLLQAVFLAVLQIVVYAGAIMALFLFVVMMVDPQKETGPAIPAGARLVLPVLLLLAGVVIWVMSSSLPAFSPSAIPLDLKGLSRELFTSYVFPFESIAILITSSVIGALYIAKKEDV